MSTLEEAYDVCGEYLGDEFVDLSGLQRDTRRAILQVIYLDNMIDSLEIEAEVKGGKHE